MEMSESPLAIELELIQNSMPLPVLYRYEAEVTTERETLTAMSVVRIERIRDYRRAWTDEILVDLVFPSGMYASRIQPFKENLKITLTKIPSQNLDMDNPIAIVEQDYVANPIRLNENTSLGDNAVAASEEAMDLASIEVFTFQLTELAFDHVKSYFVGGIPKACTAFDLLVSLLWQSIKDLELDEANMIQGVQTVPPDNTVKRDHFLIPHGMPLVSLAEKLQTQFGGIYNSGIGCYLQGAFWYVWPLFDYTRFETEKKTATFIILPDAKIMAIEKTWRKTANHFVAVITGGVNKIDLTEVSLINDGTGTRFGDPHAIMEGFVTKGGNKAVAQRSFNATEYDAAQRRGPGSVARVNENMMSTNPYNEASRIAERNAAYIKMNWENSEPSLITPGLQVEIGFTSNKVPRYLQGVVVHAHVFDAIAGTGLHQTIHQVTTEVVVMVDRRNPQYQEFLDDDQNSL